MSSPSSTIDTVELSDGSAATVRLLTSSDRPGVQELFDSTSEVHL